MQKEENNSKKSTLVENISIQEREIKNDRCGVVFGPIQKTYPGVCTNCTYNISPSTCIEH
jgi:hypothetical protein